MTDFAKTIANSLNALGGGVTRKWNAFLWGTFWGEGSIGFAERLVTHQFSSPCTVATIEHFDVLHGLENAQGTDTGFVFGPIVMIGSSLTLQSNPDDMRLLDGAGYTYVFPSGASDLLDRDFPIYTSSAANLSTWTTSTVGTPTWSTS